MQLQPDRDIQGVVYLSKRTHRQVFLESKAELDASRMSSAMQTCMYT